MALSEVEFERLLADPTKRIAGDVAWVDDLSHPPARKFRASVDSDGGWPLVAFGWWQPSSGKLTYGLLHPEGGRILGLDLGYPPHGNPTGEVLPGVHKHRWTEAYRGDWAYEPSDITAGWDQPREVWRQFCAETGIVHAGEFPHPRARSTEERSP